MHLRSKSFAKTVFMRRINKVEKIVLLMLMTFLPTITFAENEGNSEKAYDWDRVAEAIIQVESKGDTKAVNGSCVGAMQISPALVQECNRILKKRKSKKRFKLSDRLSLAKSKEMFAIFQSYYNPLNSIEKAIRSWNGGNNFSKRATQRYFSKVMKVLEG